MADIDAAVKHIEYAVAELKRADACLGDKHFSDRVNLVEAQRQALAVAISILQQQEVSHG